MRKLAGREAGAHRAFPAPGTFTLLLNFSEDYPNKAPGVRFLTKMFHPNSEPPRPPPARRASPPLTLRATAQSTPTAASVWTF